MSKTMSKLPYQYGVKLRVFPSLKQKCLIKCNREASCFIYVVDLMQDEYKKHLIETYFKMWIKRDFSGIDNIFAKDIFYRECYGACYCNLNEVHLWINRQLKKQIVLSWPIHTVNVDNNCFFVTWTFYAKEEKKYIFDGISQIEFNDDAKISKIIEYETKHELFYPFRK